MIDYCPRCGATLKDGKCMNEKCPLVGTQIKKNHSETTIQERWLNIKELLKNPHDEKTRDKLLELIVIQSDEIHAETLKLEAMKKDAPEHNHEETVKALDLAIEDNSAQQDRLLHLVDLLCDIGRQKTIDFLKELKRSRGEN